MSGNNTHFQGLTNTGQDWPLVILAAASDLPSDQSPPANEGAATRHPSARQPIIAQDLSLRANQSDYAILCPESYYKGETSICQWPVSVTDMKLKSGIYFSFLFFFLSLLISFFPRIFFLSDLYQSFENLHKFAAFSLSFWRAVNYQKSFVTVSSTSHLIIEFSEQKVDFQVQNTAVWSHYLLFVLTYTNENNWR